MNPSHRNHLIADALINLLLGLLLLLFWLVFGKLDLPLRGQVTLWIVALLVLGIGIIETLNKTWRYDD